MNETETASKYDSGKTKRERERETEREKERERESERERERESFIVSGNSQREIEQRGIK